MTDESKQALMSGLLLPLAVGLLLSGLTGAVTYGVTVATVEVRLKSAEDDLREIKHLRQQEIKARGDEARAVSNALIGLDGGVKALDATLKRVEATMEKRLEGVEKTGADRAATLNHREVATDGELPTYREGDLDNGGLASYGAGAPIR